MRNETIFTMFKVWDKKKLTEKEVREVAIDHFNDIVETFGLPAGSYLECASVTKLKGWEKMYLYKIISAYMPRGSNQ